MKKLLLLLLFPLLLVSCGKSHYYGHYAFQMGSDRSSHFGMFIDLKKEKYDKEKPQLGERFKFGAMLSEDMVPKPSENPEDYPDISAFFEDWFISILVGLMNTEQNPEAGLEGYYLVSDKYIEGKGLKLDMNIVLDIGEEEEPIEADFLKKFLIAYLDNKILNIVLPVSLPDLQYQLCWYGIYIYIDKENLEEPILIQELESELPGPKNEDRLGSHPSSESDIEKMNNIIKEEITDEKQRFTFKDWNTLTVGLTK